MPAAFVKAIAVCVSLAALWTGAARAQSDAERSATADIQQAYFRTLSAPPSQYLVDDAQRAFDMTMAAYGATAGRTADMAVNLGRALNATQQYDAAASALESAVTIYRDQGSDAVLRRAVAQYELGVALMGQGDMTRASAALTDAYSVLQPTFSTLSADANNVRAALEMAGGADAIAAARQAASPVPDTRQPEPAVKIPPVYPPDAGNVGGWVLLDYRLWPDGTVRDVFVLAGHPQGVFDISAATALTYWRFKTPVDAAKHYQLNVAFKP